MMLSAALSHEHESLRGEPLVIHMSKLRNIKIARLTNIIGPGCVSDSGKSRSDGEIHKVICDSEERTKYRNSEVMNDGS